MEFVKPKPTGKGPEDWFNGDVWFDVIHAGTALIGTRDGTVYETHPDETVTCPPGEEHWHGATADRFMQHLALWDAVAPDDDRPETTWLEHVTDEQYQAPRTRSN
ncbi:cupin domain-containing protein [Streptacidiphilus sp. N1-12]|uniref:Cupin domain-containing protein n=2 Tax=Streptacidiphilus alkalitolerans TaxID=3342712 RepID=A0ABV6WHI9_9ACTN